MRFHNPFKKKSIPSPTKTDVLRARPVRNPAVTWGPDKRGDMVIHVPLQKKRWATRIGRFIPAPEVRHILLDDIGADVWEMCDGETSIEAIRRRITEKYKLNRKEAEASLIAHLQNLARRKLIVTVAGSPEEGENPEAAPSDAFPLKTSPARNRRKKRR